MNKFSKDLLRGLQEACEFAEGKVSVARLHVVEQVSDAKPSQTARKVLGRVVHLQHPTVRRPRGGLGSV